MSEETFKIAKMKQAKKNDEIEKITEKIAVVIRNFFLLDIGSTPPF